MRKNLFIVLALVLIIAGQAMAQDVGFAFSQTMETDWAEGETQGSLSETVAAASVTLFSNDSYSLGLNVGDTLEMTFAPGDLGTGTVTTLGDLGVTNTVALGIGNTISVAEYLAILVNFDFEFGSGLATSATGSPRVDLVLKPTLGAEGSVSGLSYSVAQSLLYYTDQDGDPNADSDYIELDGTYALGFLIDLSDSFSLSFNVEDNLIVTFNDGDNNDVEAVSAIENEFTLKATLGWGGVSPYIGLLLCQTDDDFDTSDNDVQGVGFVGGLGFAKDAWSVELSYEGSIDINSAKEDEKWGNTASVSLGIEM